MHLTINFIHKIKAHIYDNKTERSGQSDYLIRRKETWKGTICRLLSSCSMTALTVWLVEEQRLRHARTGSRRAGGGTRRRSGCSTHRWRTRHWQLAAPPAAAATASVGGGARPFPHLADARSQPLLPPRRQRLAPCPLLASPSPNG